ncbi:sugar phosphate isomerase/epimerase family protein [Bacillus infantis]|uniref:sugar phosphate isomerase/epimerase family protein n=1 Tax=Bacillus infantis TaxID=324767 RepID=UPI003CF7EC1E
MNLGIRAHDIEKDSLEELAEEIGRKGFSCIQLALGKSLPALYPSPGTLSPGLARYIGKTFGDAGVQIAVLGCYVNLIHPDLSERRKGLEKFKEHIRYARDFGCSIVGTETGSVLPEMGYSERNFEEKPFLDAVESVAELAQEAEKFGVIVGVEAGVYHPVHSAERLKRLLDLVDSNNVQVIFDPANLITVENYHRQDELLAEAIELLGEKIAIFHAKDFVVEEDQVKIVPAGQGLLNYSLISKLLKDQKPYIQVLMEGTKEPDIDRCADYLRREFSSRSIGKGLLR